MYNPLAELREALQDMRDQGLTKQEMALEFLAPVLMFAVAILGFIVLADYF
jgi:hypothetical protein